MRTTNEACKCVYGKETVLDLPNDIDLHKEHRTVAVDPCISKVILFLWRKGIDMRGCCCGHNKEKPSIVIAKKYTEDGIARIKHIIKSIDNRKWSIFQWRQVGWELIEVS